MRPLIHQTDLFRPHADPDDHWDLACIYGLGLLGLCDLKGIIVDYPPAHHSGTPDAGAIAQMNYLTGRAVPFATGHHAEFKDLPVGTSPSGAVELILDILSQSTETVTIQIVGSARDVAAAVRRDPDVFARNCRGIYLNAGTGETPGRPEIELEYNVRLDPEAYRALFDAPCPLFWAPCFERLGVQNWTVSKHGSWWNFHQADIMDRMNPRLQNYFMYMFQKIESSAWLAWLEQDVDPASYLQFASQDRNMWCTASFLHSVGRTVTADGRIAAIGTVTDPVFEFIPISVSCDERFLTHWRPDETSTDRFVLRIRDIERYTEAMTRALSEMVAGVGM